MEQWATKLFFLTHKHIKMISLVSYLNNLQGNKWFKSVESSTEKKNTFIIKLAQQETYLPSEYCLLIFTLCK